MRFQCEKCSSLPVLLKNRPIFSPLSQALTNRNNVANLGKSKNPTSCCNSWGFHIQDYGTLYYVMACFEMNVAFYNKIIG